MDQEKFVSKDEIREYTNIFAEVFGEIQKKLKKDKGLTFSYNLQPYEPPNKMDNIIIMLLQ